MKLGVLLWRQRVIIVVLLIGFGLSLAAFFSAQWQFERQRQLEFTWVANNRISLLHQELMVAINTLQLIVDVVDAQSIDQPQILQPLISRQLERNPRLGMITILGENGITLRLPNEPKAPLPASAAPFSPKAETEHWLYTQCQPGKPMAVSERIAHDRNKWGETLYGVLILLPLSPKTTHAKCVVGLLELDAIAHIAISHLEPRGVDLIIDDVTLPTTLQPLEFYSSRLNPDQPMEETLWQQRLQQAPLKLSKSLLFGDRQWRITAISSNLFVSAEAFSSGAWIILAAGVILTLMVAIYLLHMRLQMRQRLGVIQQLHEREELFWQMTETVDDFFWAMPQTADHFLYVSPAFETLWGYSCETLYHHFSLFTETMHKDDVERWQEALQQALKSAGSVEVLYRILPKNGGQRWIRDSIFAVRDEKMSVVRLVGVAEDVTERKQAEDTLQESEQKLRTLFNQSPDTIMTINRSGKILLINRGAALEGGSDLSRPGTATELLPAQSHDEFNRQLQRAFQQARVTHFAYRQQDGSWREIRMVPIQEAEQVTAMMVIATDITEKRNLEAQAIRNARLASIGVLATGVAHEINNPNNAIHNGAALFVRIWQDTLPILREFQRDNGDFSLGGLSFSKEGESIRELVNEIVANSRRIEAIVANLKHLGRDSYEEPRVAVDINQIILAAERVIASTIRKHTDHWKLQLAPDLPPLQGNPQQLEQVMINLIMNALQALPDRNSGVRISTRLESKIQGEEAALLIEVEDDGEGIEAEDLPRVTEPFFTTRL
ncbi:MAG: PAS domain S-box protein, partial [Gammaproteobacteria bacterium]|nr:PAS domain S-box protein [Gammaproteobacteria bacterium]